MVDSLDEALARMTAGMSGSRDSGESSVGIDGSPGQIYQQKDEWMEPSKQPRNEVSGSPWQSKANTPASSGPDDVAITQAGSLPLGHRPGRETEEQILAQVTSYFIQKNHSSETQGAAQS